MDTKRVITKTSKFIEYEESLKKLPRPVKFPKKVIKPVEVPKDEVIKYAIPIEPLRSLDLTQISKQDLKDFYNIDNPFYTNNFIKILDDITDRYNFIVEKFGDRLPIIYINGIANLEGRPWEAPKNIVSFSKLKYGDYETAGSKSDKTNITASIKFFFNNLPSFKQYEKEDNLNYIIDKRRLLMVELLEYFYNQPKFSLATLKSRYVAIMRIMRLAYNGKSNLDYQLLSYIVSILGDEVDNKEGQNVLSPEELERFLDFDLILLKQKELYHRFYNLNNKKTKNAFELNQDLVLLSLYTLIPPLRNEPKILEYTLTTKNEGDYIFLRSDDVILDLNEEKKRHDAIGFNLTKDAPKLAEILKDSYDLYPRTFVFVPKTNYNKFDKKSSVSSLDDRLFRMFREYGIRIGTNSLRSSYVSKFYETATKNRKQRTYGEQEMLAYRMRTSVKYLQQAYNKILENPSLKVEVDKIDVKEEPRDDVEIPTITPDIQPSEPKTRAVNSYNKQLERSRLYYQINKEKVLKKQAEYNKKNAGKSYIVRLLKYLNDDNEYINKAKKETLAKYKIELVDGRYISNL